MGYIHKYEYIYTNIELIHVVVQQKLTQHCKATILRLKNNFFKKLGGYLYDLRKGKYFLAKIPKMH